MDRFCISLVLILSATSKAFGLIINTNNYYETSFIGDEKKVKELWLELDDPEYENATMTYSFEEASKAYEESIEKYGEYNLRLDQNLSFDFSFFGETVHSVRIYGNGYMYLAEQFTGKRTPLHDGVELQELEYFASIIPIANSDFKRFRVSPGKFIRWFHNDSQFTVSWVNIEFKTKPEQTMLGTYTFQTTLFKTGDIAFVYKFISVHNVSVKLIDGYMMSNKTIYKYPHHSINLSDTAITNWSSIYLKPLPNCLDHKDVDSCLSFSTTSHMNCCSCQSH
ncbi:hypothetical protein WDU94_012473 [Cyamophila willieti]